VDTQQGFENVLVLDNIPIVDESRKQRLVDRLCQTFEKAGAALEQDRMSMPWDDKAGTNKGCVTRTHPLLWLTTRSASSFLPTLMRNKQRTPYACLTGRNSVKPIPCISTGSAISSDMRIYLLAKESCPPVGGRNHSSRRWVGRLRVADI